MQEAHQADEHPTAKGGAEPGPSVLQGPGVHVPLQHPVQHHPTVWNRPSRAGRCWCCRGCQTGPGCSAAAHHPLCPHHVAEAISSHTPAPNVALDGHYLAASDSERLQVLEAP